MKKLMCSGYFVVISISFISWISALSRSLSISLHIASLCSALLIPSLIKLSSVMWTKALPPISCFKRKYTNLISFTYLIHYSYNTNLILVLYVRNENIIFFISRVGVLGSIEMKVTRSIQEVTHISRTSYSYHWKAAEKNFSWYQNHSNRTINKGRKNTFDQPGAFRGPFSVKLCRCKV